MKNYIFLIAFLAISLVSKAQNRYQKGYIIDQKGSEKQGFVFDSGTNSTPQKIQFKPSKEADAEKLNVNNVREFGFNGNVYRKYSVEIDRSTNRLEALGADNRPDFSQEELFLELLVDGDANLYSYAGKGITRYFYSVENDGKVEQLIYKRYKKKGNKIGENNRFKQQIFSDMDCEGMDQLKLSRLDYQEADLANFFDDYNACRDGAYQSRIKTGDEGLKVRVGPHIGARSVNLDLENTRFKQEGEFDQKTTFRYGVAFEFLPPGYNQKWAILIEPSFQKYDNQTVLENNLSNVNDESITAKIDYSSVEIPLGVRYYMFATDELRFMINAGYTIDIPMNNEVTAEFPDDSNLNLLRSNLEIKSSGNLFVGAGAKYNQIGIEFRFGTGRNLLELDEWDSKYKYFQVALSYDLFEF